MKLDDLQKGLRAWNLELELKSKDERKTIFMNNREMLVISGCPPTIEPLRQVRQTMKSEGLPNPTPKQLNDLGFELLKIDSAEYLDWKAQHLERVKDEGTQLSKRKDPNRSPLKFWVKEELRPVVAKNDLTSSHILKAMERFISGERPDGYKKPRGWHVVHPDTQEPLPLKGIYGLATGRSCSHDKPNSFTTDEARPRLKKLGFECINIMDDPLGEELQGGIERSNKNTSEARRERLRSAPPKPVKTMQKVVRYHRNPDVIAERLYLAQGKCEGCGNPAPFLRKRGGIPYLEVHHINPLADGGDDTVDNTRALCPNCHREVHYGPNS